MIETSIAYEGLDGFLQANAPEDVGRVLAALAATAIRKAWGKGKPFTMA